MGINIPASSSLGSVSSQFFLVFFFFSAKMNLTVFAGILLAVTMATARRASLGEKTMQAAGKADEPEGAMRESVEKMMRAADEADEPARAKRGCKKSGETCANDGECCGKCGAVKSMTPKKTCSGGPGTSLYGNYGGLVEKIMRAADKADEPAGAKRAYGKGCTQPNGSCTGENDNSCCDDLRCGQVHRPGYPYVCMRG